MQYKYTAARPKHHNNEEEEEMRIELPFADQKPKQYRQFDQTFTAQHVHFYLSKPITDPSEYTDMIYRITVAGPSDVIFIHLNTPGGQIDTGVQLINAMQNSQAKIVTVLESVAYSLGTLIFLAGDEMVVNDHCMMMFHNFNGGLIGKGNELVAELAATVKWFETLAKDIYIPFLSPDEYDRITKGEDMWMQSEEIRVRLDKMVKEINKKIKAEQAAMDKLEQLAAEAELKQKAARKKKPAAKKTQSKRGRPAKKVESDEDLLLG